MNTTATGGGAGQLSPEVMSYLSKDFLERSLQANPHRVGFKLKTLGQNSGKTITWPRLSPLSTTGATTALTEGTTPTAVDLTENSVTATLAQYGRHTTVSDFLNYTSVDEAASEKKDVMATHASEVADTLARELMYTGSTVQFANSKGSLAGLAVTDVMNGTETRKAVRALKKANATPYQDGYFIGKIGPDTAFDIFGDAVWVNAHTYKDGDNLYQGEVGRLFQVRFIEASSNQKSEASTVTVYSNFIHGQNAFGAVNLAGQPKAANGEAPGARNMQLIVKMGGEQDTSNPLNLYFTIGWKFVDALATLNSTWSVNIKSGASL
jgi:N4-gp56 family major capsid protein